MTARSFPNISGKEHEMLQELEEGDEKAAAEVKECQQFLLDCSRGSGPSGCNLTEHWAHKLSTLLSQYHTLLVPPLSLREIVEAMGKDAAQVTKLDKLYVRGILTQGEVAEAVREINNTGTATCPVTVSAPG